MDYSLVIDLDILAVDGSLPTPTRVHSGTSSTVRSINRVPQPLCCHLELVLLLLLLLLPDPCSPILH